jgi:hypothetical protein
MFNANETKGGFTVSEIKGNILLENIITDHQKIYFVRKYAHLFGGNIMIPTGDMRQLRGTRVITCIFLRKG